MPTEMTSSDRKEVINNCLLAIIVLAVILVVTGAIYNYNMELLATRKTPQVTTEQPNKVEVAK